MQTWRRLWFTCRAWTHPQTDCVWLHFSSCCLEDSYCEGVDRGHCGRPAPVQVKSFREIILECLHLVIGAQEEKQKEGTSLSERFVGFLSSCPTQRRDFCPLNVSGGDLDSVMMHSGLQDTPVGIRVQGLPRPPSRPLGPFLLFQVHCRLKMKAGSKKKPHWTESLQFLKLFWHHVGSSFPTLILETSQNGVGAVTDQWESRKIERKVESKHQSEVHLCCNNNLGHQRAMACFTNLTSGSVTIVTDTGPRVSLWLRPSFFRSAGEFWFVKKKISQ